MLFSSPTLRLAVSSKKPAVLETIEVIIVNKQSCLGMIKGIKMVNERRTFRVLIVDDMLTMRMLLRGLIEGMGLPLVTTSATNGQEALAIADTISPDLILLDFQMPDMTGTQVRQALRDAGHSCPIVFVTAEKRSTVGRDSIEDPATAYVLKCTGKNDMERFNGEVRFQVRTSLRQPNAPASRVG